MSTHITWEGGALGRQTGYIYGEAKGHKVKVEVFGISRNPDRGNLDQRWILAHRLPFRGIERRFGTVRLAQDHAERYLLWAFELMGFVPKEDD